MRWLEQVTKATNGLKRAPELPSYPNFTRRSGMSARNALLETVIKFLLLLNVRHFMQA